MSCLDCLWNVQKKSEISGLSRKFLYYLDSLWIVWQVSILSPEAVSGLSRKFFILSGQPRLFPIFKAGNRFQVEAFEVIASREPDLVHSNYHLEYIYNAFRFVFSWVLLYFYHLNNIDQLGLSPIWSILM